jgi:amino acid adenylation domain-containing protein
MTILAPPNKESLELENCVSETVGTAISRSAPFVIEDDVSTLLTSVANANGLSEASFLLSVFQELVRRYLAQPNVRLKVKSSSGGWLDFTLAGNPSILDAARQAREKYGETKTDGTGTGSLDAQFSFERSTELPILSKLADSAAPLELSFDRVGTDLVGTWTFKPNIWDVGVIDTLPIAYKALLRAALTSPDTPIQDLDLVTSSNRTQLTPANDIAVDYPKERVDQIFHQRMVEDPDRTAVSFAGETFTYRTLAERTNSLAARLSLLGVKPGTLVGICLERCNDMVAALLAVFKAGGAYVPLDPAYPAERIDFMLKDAAPVVVITQSHLSKDFNFSPSTVLCLDAEDSSNSQPPISTNDLTASEASLDDRAYVLYTSGSTGKPKGVEITHRSLINLLAATIRLVELEKRDVFLATTTISFDISAFEIFAPLILGAQIVMAPRSVTVSGELLANEIVASGATVLQATPSGWRVLLESGWIGEPRLKMLTAGEPLDRTLAGRLLDRGQSLWNLYGPTEAAIYASGCRITRSDRKITIGKPLPNYGAWVVGPNRKCLPIGAIGELYLSGIGLARGYLNSPELTREKFVANPFGWNAGEIFYKTGDLARILPNGEVELFGRVDHQVKLRGYRIELEEVEALLDRHPLVGRCIVKVVDAAEGDQRLVAFIVRRGPEPIDEAQLRAYASRSLPSYMVPSAYLEVDKFALTPSGKVDRKALLDYRLHDALDHSLNGHLTDVDKVVVECWQNLLKVPTVQPDDDFFAVGGHSLLAARLVSAISERLKIKLPISLLVETPTPSGLANRIKKAKEIPFKSLVPMQTSGNLPPLYLVHHSLGDLLVYYALAQQFAPERKVFGIQPPEDSSIQVSSCTLEGVAAGYVQEVLEQQTSGPFHLAGFSSGSVMAFEIAQQLIRAGHQVGVLALIDGEITTVAPAFSKFTTAVKKTVRKFAKICFKLQDELKEGPKQFISKRWRYMVLMRQLRHLQKSGSSAGGLTLEQSLLLAESKYLPMPYQGNVSLLRFRDEAWNFGPNPLMGWEGLIRGRIQVTDFPGGHITGMSPAAAPRLAGVLKAQMADAEAIASNKS